MHTNKTWILLSLITLVILNTSCLDQDETDEVKFVATVSQSISFSPSDSEETLINKGVTSVKSGDKTIYVGYQQVSANNQNPIAACFVDGQQQWVRTNYEFTDDDNKGYGLIWDGGEALYAVFSVTGTQGESSDDFRRFAQNGWLTSYGKGGGAKASVIAQINHLNGDIVNATFLYAKLSNGNTNSLVVTDLQLSKQYDLIVRANSWYSPLKTDKTTFECQGESPFDYTITFTSDLSTALETNAKGCL